MKATALSHPNIGLVKYWGKRDEALILPQTGSISVTLDSLWTKTTIEFSERYDRDTIFINDAELASDEKNIIGTLDRVRELAKIDYRARVQSETNFPVAAGLASSASGLSAISLAATTAASLSLKPNELSILTRRLSGSACRSLEGGFVEWRRGEKSDGSDSYAVQLHPADHWPEFRLFAAVVDYSQKPVTTRAGMTQTIATCPYYDGWIQTVERDLVTLREAIAKKDFSLLGKTSELNALRMHALMIATDPPIIYWLPESIKVIQSVRRWREDGLECYFTMDAGPQVKVLCLEKDCTQVKGQLSALDGVKEVLECKPGEGAKLVTDHLF